ncbi:hypothetical protein R6242_16145 [Iodobacter sp. CM08]|uniref:hypothetical protein n=1 Tax=Iodobacter sp. CM08 TaxID=3085902 RepID=UPI0029825AB5|nr:hypothetical protein [Iodobacter sp. CM08]MDW5418098.1 hypothetical protein [Iodobacter sp. CM08]
MNKFLGLLIVLLASSVAMGSKKVGGGASQASTVTANKHAELFECSFTLIENNMTYSPCATHERCMQYKINPRIKDWGEQKSDKCNKGGM